MANEELIKRLANAETVKVFGALNGPFDWRSHLLSDALSTRLRQHPGFHASMVVLAEEEFLSSTPTTFAEHQTHGRMRALTELHCMSDRARVRIIGPGAKQSKFYAKIAPILESLTEKRVKIEGIVLTDYWRIIVWDPTQGLPQVAPLSVAWHDEANNRLQEIFNLLLSDEYSDFYSRSHDP